MQIEIGRLEELFISLIDRVTDDDEWFQTRSRAGIFSPALTMWVTIFSRIQGKKSLSRSLQQISNGESSRILGRNKNHREHTIKNISLLTGGLSRAQKRLDEIKLNQLVQAINEVLIKECNPKYLWHGKNVYVFDGTTLVLTPSDANKSIYSSIRNVHGEAYSPHMLCMFCHELFSGVALYPKYGAYRGENKTHESDLFYKMIDDLPQNSIMMGDRAYGIFPVVYEANRRGHDVLVRLSVTQAKNLAGGRKILEANDFIDTEVEWKFKTTKAEHLKIPEESSVKGRFVKYVTRRAGAKPLELYFFTTLSQPLEEILNLYSQRERIENDIRTIKHTLGMERFFAKTPKMINFELVLGLLAYNLVRAIISKAAAELKINPRLVSFTRASELINTYGNKIRYSKSKEEIKECKLRFLKGIMQTKLPVRKDRMEPRKLATKKDDYPVLKDSRAIEKVKIKLELQAFGHRGLYKCL